MEHKRAAELIEKYLTNTCTDQERAYVERNYNELIELNTEVYNEDQLQEESKVLWKRLAEQISPGSVARRKRISIYSSAAAVLMVLGIGYYFLGQPLPPQDQIPFTKIIKDVAPGGNNAILTLSNGQRIDLKKASTGNIANNLNLSIHKKNEGELVFTGSAISKTATVSTPKGGQFIVQLPDGSKVWLNAATQIKFPADFKGLKNRTVELSGEAYFEVAKNAKQPFIVETQNQKVQVLGTHFNINSYPDEPAVRTTLLEGAVRIFSTRLNTNLSEILKPGQMALHQDNKIAIQAADQNAIAWKEGLMKFKETDLPSLMRQVSRWYNLTVKYEGPISTKRFTGGVTRESNLSDLLYILEGMGIHFTIQRQGNENFLIIKN